MESFEGYPSTIQSISITSWSLPEKIEKAILFSVCFHALCDLALTIELDNNLRNTEESLALINYVPQ